MASDAPARFEPEDILSFKLVSDIDLSPDGRWLVYAVQEIDQDNDEYATNLWLIATDGGSPRQLTFGSDQNQSPRFAPDSEQVAFLSDRGGKPQLYVMHVNGGEARRLTALDGGAGEPVWSPDGASLLFAARVAQQGSSKAPRVVTRASYKMDGAGFVLDRPRQLFLVPVAGGKVRQLTTGAASASDPAWSPDGRSIAFCRNRTGAQDAHRRDIWVMTAGGQGLRQVTHACTGASQPSWSPDGQRIAFYGPREEGSARYLLWLVNGDGSGERPLVSDDVEIAGFALGRTAAPVWRPDGAEIGVVLASQSMSEVALVPAEGGAMRKAISDERQITMLSAAPGADRIAFLWSDPRLCGMLGTASWNGSDERRLLNVNEDWAGRHAWPEATLRESESGSGTPNLGLLLRPPGGGTGPMPLLVDVHGGPLSHVSLGFPYHPYWYALTARGWAVLALNAVGSAAFGKEFAESLRGHWGERDLPEHLAAVDQLVREGIADGERIAIAGKSYGGYMVAWAIGKTRRFRAAVCSAPISNLESHFGTSDTGYYVDAFHMRGPPSEARERYRELSPIRGADRAETPTLILHGERDQRCPIGQSEELFAALVCAGKAPVELVRYPGGSHKLAETGRPSHRVDYHRRIVDWLETHCGKPTPAAPGPSGALTSPDRISTRLPADGL